ncbi:MAG: bifunctional adenosylcobinamide kinase/adenosylcobinamide-phosphate guanylyltransferase [Oscillospiraceae bacterium]
MLCLVLGGTASGKSEFAEELAVKLDKREKIYIATMLAFDDECLKKIERHQKMRKEKGFITVESPLDLHNIKSNLKGTAMLECMSNLLANEMYRTDIILDDVVLHILNGIKYANDYFENLIIVSNNVFGSQIEYDQSTEEYIKKFGLINSQIASEADIVVEVVCGIPIFHKGEGIIR